MTTFEAVKPLEPGKAVEVFERDESGFLVGAWFGYWNYNRQTVALYPNVKNRFVNWPGGRIPSGRIVVSDRAVSVQSAKVSSSSIGVACNSSPPSSIPGKAEAVQERIKFD